ncbi:hypothetical protein LguiA_030614 [Lonicera macranthoides]
MSTPLEGRNGSSKGASHIGRWGILETHISNSWSLIKYKAFWELTGFGSHENSEVKRVVDQSNPRMGDPPGKLVVSSQKQSRAGKGCPVVAGAEPPKVDNIVLRWDQGRYKWYQSGPHRVRCVDEDVDSLGGKDFISKTLVPEGHNVLAHSRSDYSDTGTNLDSTPNYYGDPNPYEVYSEIQYARATYYKEFEPIGGSAAGVKQSCGVPKLLVCPLLNEHAKNVWRAIRIESSQQWVEAKIVSFSTMDAAIADLKQRIQILHEKLLPIASIVHDISQVTMLITSKQEEKRSLEKQLTALQKSSMPPLQTEVPSVLLDTTPWSKPNPPMLVNPWTYQYAPPQSQRLQTDISSKDLSPANPESNQK